MTHLSNAIVLIRTHSRIFGKAHFIESFHRSHAQGEVAHQVVHPMAARDFRSGVDQPQFFQMAEMVAQNFHGGCALFPAPQGPSALCLEVGWEIAEVLPAPRQLRVILRNHVMLEPQSRHARDGLPASASRGRAESGQQSPRRIARAVPTDSIG